MAASMDAVALRAWRRAERERLLALRGGLSGAQRQELASEIAAGIAAVLSRLSPGMLGIYWPFKGEFDPRPSLAAWQAMGWRLALPAVIDKAGPLEYRAWNLGEALVDGVWGIPVPARREAVAPTAVLAPLVGFDRAFFRLGYGGGYFDRTLAALAPCPYAIGVGFSQAALDTIHPQEYDRPMDAIVTEAGARYREPEAGDLPQTISSA